MSCVFFFNDTATTEIYTLSLHDALPISGAGAGQHIGDCPVSDVHRRVPVMRRTTIEVFAWCAALTIGKSLVAQPTNPELALEKLAAAYSGVTNVDLRAFQGTDGSFLAVHAAANAQGSFAVLNHAQGPDGLPTWNDKPIYFVLYDGRLLKVLRSGGAMYQELTPGEGFEGGFGAVQSAYVPWALVRGWTERVHRSGPASLRPAEGGVWEAEILATGIAIRWNNSGELLSWRKTLDTRGSYLLTEYSDFDRIQGAPLPKKIRQTAHRAGTEAA